MTFNPKHRSRPRHRPTLWVRKKQDIKLLPITSPNINQFPNSFNSRLVDKFATNSYLHIPPHFRYVATLPCKIWTSEKRRKSELCIAINDKSQGSIAKHLSWGGLQIYHSIFAGERICNIGEHLEKLQAKWLIVSYAPFSLHFCHQRCRTRQIRKVTSVLRTETVTNRSYVNR